MCAPQVRRTPAVEALLAQHLTRHMVPSPLSGLQLIADNPASPVLRVLDVKWEVNTLQGSVRGGRENEGECLWLVRCRLGAQSCYCKV